MLCKSSLSRDEERNLSGEDSVITGASIITRDISISGIYISQQTEASLMQYI